MEEYRKNHGKTDLWVFFYLLGMFVLFVELLLLLLLRYFLSSQGMDFYTLINQLGFFEIAPLFVSLSYLFYYIRRRRPVAPLPRESHEFLGSALVISLFIAALYGVANNDFSIGFLFKAAVFCAAVVMALYILFQLSIYVFLKRD